MRRMLIIILIITAAMAFCAIYYTHDPSSSALFPRCLFLSLTGYKCPGCGSQRAIHALLNGDVVGAFRYNAMLLIAIPWITLCLFVETQRTRWPKLYARLNPQLLILLFMALVLAWWLFRNIFNW